MSAGVAASRQLPLKGFVGHVLPRVGVGGVQIALAHVEFQRACLREQNVLRMRSFRGSAWRSGSFVRERSDASRMADRPGRRPRA